MEEVPATVELVVVELDDELDVPDRAELGAPESRHVFALCVVQVHPRAERSALGRADEQVWLLLIQLCACLLPFTLDR